MGIFDRDLWTPDEPRVAAMALEMTATGNYIIPHLAGEPFVEKPPLYYAFAGFMIKMLGNVLGIAGAVRFSTVLWGLGVLGFAGLTSRRLLGKGTGILTMAVLATMAGFVENFHWIRVDAALAFFVMAAVWSSVEGSLADKSGLFILTGLFSGGAFLSKGLIGPVLIMIPIGGLFISRKLIYHRFLNSKRDLLPIFGGIIAFVLMVLLWLSQLKLHSDSSTWYEWFYVNQLGRLTGKASHKGHIHSHDPLYYLKTIALYTLPWVPFVFAWFIKTIKNFKSLPKEEKAAALFLLFWGLGSYIVLSIPATKRDIYLVPALPGYAIIVVAFLRTKLSKWCRFYSWFIVGLSILLLSIFSISPLVVPIWINFLPQKIHDLVQSWSIRNGLCLIALCASICMALLNHKRQISHGMCVFICSALIFSSAFILPFHMVNYDKNLEPGISQFLKEIPFEQRNRIAGWNFSQTMLGAFYVYGDWVVPQVKCQDQLNQILVGEDEQFDSIIINQVHSIDDYVSVPYEILLKGHPRDQRHYRSIFWISGVEMHSPIHSDTDL